MQSTARFWFVTKGSVAVAGSEISRDALAQTTVWGFVRTLALEHPELRPGCVDLPPVTTARDLDALANELRAGTNESQAGL